MNYKAMTKANLIARIQELETQSPKATSNLQVTACHIYPFDESPTGTLKALATIILSDAFQIRNLGVKSGPSGLFVDYPYDPLNKGIVGRSICNPITKELRNHIEATVLAKYHEAIATTTESNNA
jgi:stage V sporulation protein G